MTRAPRHFLPDDSLAFAREDGLAPASAAWDQGGNKLHARHALLTRRSGRAR